MRIKMLEIEFKVKEIDDMRIKMLEMENQVRRLELKVSSEAEANRWVAISPQRRGTESWEEDTTLKFQ